MAGDQAQLKTLRDCGQKKIRFHHGEGGSNAQARAAAKGEVGEFSEISLGCVSGSTVGIKLLGLLKETGVAMQYPRDSSLHSLLAGMRKVQSARLLSLPCVPDSMREDRVSSILFTTLSVYGR